MFECLNCGHIFEEPITWREERSGDGWAWEECSGSPCCHSDYDEVHECKRCGVNYVPTYEDYCPECIREHEMVMFEAQMNLGDDHETFRDMTERWLNL